MKLPRTTMPRTHVLAVLAASATWLAACGAQEEAAKVSDAPEPQAMTTPTVESTLAICKALPSPTCQGGASYCKQITTFAPRITESYSNYPKNGETAGDLYRSFARRDLMQLVKYATTATYCQTSSWTYGNGGALGLGDMSEADGSIPGTRIGRPGHPRGSHINGRDMDIAYYQTGTSDNKLRAVCTHHLNGRDQYHCVAEPNKLDWNRTAIFIAKLHDSPNLRVIGVDGRVGPRIKTTIERFCNEGRIKGRACRSLRLAYETTNQGSGWFQFHHHHLHVSMNAQVASAYDFVDFTESSSLCMTPSCATEDLATSDLEALDHEHEE